MISFLTMSDTSASEPPSIEIRCPSCGQTTQTPASEEAAVRCRRCETDLTPLVRITAAADDCLARGERLLAAEVWTWARDCAEAAWRLRHDRRTADLGFLASVAGEDSPESIRQWLRRCELPEE